MNLNDMTVSQLREIAADLEIFGRSKMKKADLIAAIEYAEAPSADNIPGGIDDHAAAVAQMRANREAEEEAKAAARLARNRTNYAPATEAATQADAATVEAGITPIDADVTVPAGMFDPELTYFADGTHVVMRAQDNEQYGVTVGMTTDASPYQFQAVRFADGTVKNVAPHVLHRNDAAEQTDEEIDINTLPDPDGSNVPDGPRFGVTSDHNPHADGRPAALDLPSGWTEVGTAAAKAAGAFRKFAAVTTGEVAITRYTGCDAIATARFDGGSIGAWAAKVQGRWVLRDGDRTIRAKTLGKVAKLWAKQLGFYATTIVIDTMS